MSDKNEKDPQNGELISMDSSTDTASSTSTSSTHESSPITEPNKKSGNGVLWFIVLITLLITLGLAGAGYWYYTQQQQNTTTLIEAQQANTVQLQAILKERDDTRESLQHIVEKNNQLRDTITRLEDQNKALIQQAEAVTQQLNNMEGRRPADWLIAEADYLVRMAGRKLWLENDVRTAVLLLVNADKRLQSLADPSVLPVRAKLAEDIQTLQQMNPVSQSSVALALTGMMAQIDKLALNTFEKPKDTSTEDNELSESPNDWKQNLSKVWHSLVDNFFTIKHLDGPIEPVMSLEAQFLVKEQLRLQLMHAQSAALKGDTGLYQQSLQYAQTILSQKFNANETSVSTFISAIENLLNTDIAQPIPTELVSQKPLETLLDSRVKQVFGQGASAL